MVRTTTLAIVASASALLLVGCQTAPPPPPEPARPKTKCEAARDVINNPWSTAFARVAALEIARNAGCFGPPQPQTVIVR